MGFPGPKGPGSGLGLRELRVGVLLVHLGGCACLGTARVRVGICPPLAHVAAVEPVVALLLTLCGAAPVAT